jgi:hypothetical protein
VGHPGRTPASMHVATFDQRIEEWRQRFLATAASAIGQRVAEFGWQRVLLAGDKPVVEGFADRLPDSVRERIIGVVDANVLWEEPAAVADRFEEALDQASREDAERLVDRAIQASFEGGKGAFGWAEVLDCLVQHRVEHLFLAVDAAPEPEVLPPHVSDALGNFFPSDARRACRGAGDRLRRRRHQRARRRRTTASPRRRSRNAAILTPARPTSIVQHCPPPPSCRVSRHLVSKCTRPQ